MIRLTAGRVAGVLKAMAVLAACFAVFGWLRATSASDWPTFGHDPQRTGWAVDETTLTPANVPNLTLKWKAKLKNEPLSLTALTAPIVADHVETAQGLKTVVYVAGSSNHMFAIDAATGNVLWSHDFESHILLKDETMWLCPNNLNDTPVIDPRTGSVDVIASDGRLWGLDLGSGDVKFGPIQFVPPFSKNWSLNLHGSTIYTAISQGCGGAQSGIYAMDSHDPRRPVVRDLILANQGAGIWGRGGPTIGLNDRIYAATGDGPNNPAAGDFGSSFVDVSLRDLKVLDYYAPEDYVYLTRYDLDIGATSPVWFAAGDDNLVAAGGKGGVLYMLDADSLGEKDHHNALYKWLVNDLDNPYSTPSGKPFNWFRLRIVGGRSLAWYRLSYRFSDLDFKASRHDGYGEEWPISYAEIEPYYDLVESYIGVSGSPEGLSQLPDGKFLPAMPMSCGEVALKESAKIKFGRTVTMGRQANLTAPLSGRPPCHYCGPCERGCITHSYFSSPSVTLPAAQATGRLSLITDAVVSDVTFDLSTGRATGVRYVHRVTRRSAELQAKIVILCAQALESTRILLNSSNRQFPNGLGNSSGVLGHHLMDNVSGTGASGWLPGLAGEPGAGPPRRPNVVYVPRFQNVSDKHPDFIRGYGLQGSSQPSFAYWSDGYGKEFKQAVKHGDWTIYLKAYGECLARWENYIEIDPSLQDAWGIPALRINASFGDNDLKMSRDGATTAAEMLEAAGARKIELRRSPDVFGTAIHEVGTARMGADPKKSVLNKYCQSHDVPNLFVMDGGCFVSSPCQNPTLTMMALTCHSCAYLVDQVRRGAI